MEQFSILQRSILHTLGDGLKHTFKSNANIISNAINELIAFGFSIKELSTGIYQLSEPLILLDEEYLKSILVLNTTYKLHIFATIDSTNRYLKSLANDEYLHICCAEKQTQGRGRFGRHWHSPCAENIYCSSRWRIKSSITNLSGLSLIVSLALIATLKELQINNNIKIKWPNDIIWNDKKLAGILIEIVQESPGYSDIIIGIGININSNTLDNPLSDRAWGSLFEITGHYFDRNVIIALLISKLETYIQQFLQAGFTAFIPEWQQYDYLEGKIVTISEPSGFISGTCLGVHHDGELILKDERGILHHINSGEATLKV